ncbi:MAG TPA: nucleotidyltransferase domain-containing protein [Candidatus Krumholzibacteria bacterium]
MSGVLETDALQQAVERLAREFLPCAIYLFGSHATGHARPDSDVDLLVVLEDDSGWLSALGRRGYAAVRPIELPIELHFRSRAQFERWSEVAGSFEQEVRRTGRPLYVAQG